jgi:hypothetical protein
MLLSLRPHASFQPVPGSLTPSGQSTMLSLRLHHSNLWSDVGVAEDAKRPKPGGALPIHPQEKAQYILPAAAAPPPIVYGSQNQLIIESTETESAHFSLLRQTHGDLRSGTRHLRLRLVPRR